MNAVNAMAEKYRMPVVYSTHPRSAKFIEKRSFMFHPLVRQMKPFGFFDYNALQKNAFCVVSDSGTLAEESSIFIFRAFQSELPRKGRKPLTKAT
jgi:UDP-N-acetylglucosamine 2-epimerase (non-hydrolysing)